MEFFAKKPFFKRTLFVAASLLAGIGVLLNSLIDIQIIKSSEYQNKAFQQYTTEMTINPKRGTIYDRNMKTLAVSATVETVFISPYEIKEKGQDKELIASFLSELLEVEKESILTKMQNEKSKYQLIKKQIERETADQIRVFINQNSIKGIYLEEDTKRYYPDGNLASHIIGFTNYDNAGVYGIEAQYEKYLKGVPGKVITAQDAKGDDMPFKYESYIGAENGTNVVLTIDWSIQNFLEKALEEALVDTKAQNRVLGIVMDVNTAEILAMSTKPDYNLNSPYTLDEASNAILEAFAGTEEEKNSLRKDLLESLWKNKGVTELYEPGSTFKIITSAMAMEENVVQRNDRFYCSGVTNVAGIPIHCHKTTGHGYETFEEGLQNSCNPVFMDIAARVGKTKFMKYFEAFGFTQKTGIDLPGEESSIYYTDMSRFNEVELATHSFGQTFKVTPLQLITAVSAVANGGNLMKPHIVKELVDDDGNTIESYDPTLVRQVVSSNVGDDIMTYLMNGIDIGSTKNAYVKGYKIAAKTGTSQKRDKVNPRTGEKDLKIGSCVAFAPADDPQVAILIMIDEPSSGEYYGGVIAAPVVSKVLSDVLPYLNIAPELTESEIATLDKTVEDYRTNTIEKATRAIKEQGLNYKIIGGGNVVTEQFPRGGSTISNSGIIILYTNNELPNSNVTVPNVIGSTASAANKYIINSGLNIKMEGTHRDEVSGAVAVSQRPEAGTKVQPGTVVTVSFKHLDSYD